MQTRYILGVHPCMMLRSAGQVPPLRRRRWHIACRAAAPGQPHVHLSRACAGEALPQGMSVYSNAVHDLSASSSGRGSSSAGPLEMSLPGLRSGEPSQDPLSISA